MPFSRIRAFFSRFFESLSKRPVVSFVIILILLFGVIFLATKLRAPKDEGAGQAPALREVSTFTVGKDSPTVSALAEVKKNGIIDVVAVTSGVVKRLYVTPGQTIRGGQTIAELTADYGANAGDIRTQIANENKNLAESTQSLNKKLLDLQARLARDQATTDRQSDIAKINLKVGKKSLNNSMTISELNAALAAAENAPLRPRSFVSGTVSSIPVSLGDYVSAGTVLATISATQSGSILEVKLPVSVAVLFDPTSDSFLHVDNKDVSLIPRFIAPGEDSHGLVTLQFEMPEDAAKAFADHSFMSISLALEKTSEGATLIPIDALYQDKNGSSVLITDNDNVAQLKDVTLRKIIGNFALIEGLSSGERLVTDRLTAAGDKVQPITR